jgi:hypothetical protein
MSYDENLRSMTLDADATVGIYTGVPGQPGSAVPNNGFQYCGVKMTGARQCGLAVAAGDILIGVLQNKPQRPGAAAQVGYEGVTNVIAGAAFSAGVELVVNATGKFIAGASTGNGRKLISQKAATVAGEMVPAVFV